MSLTLDGSNGITFPDGSTQAVSSSGGGILAGTLIHFCASTAPTGYLKANGAAISRSTYSALFTAIGTTFGTGDGSTTFNVPDARGYFVRGWDDARAVDTGRTFGSNQAANISSHNHTATDSGHSHGITDPGHSHTMYQAMSRDATGNADGAQTNQGTFGGGGGQFWGHPNTASATTGISINNGTASVTIGSSGSGTDTRPVNLALLACIKY